MRVAMNGAGAMLSVWLMVGAAVVAVPASARDAKVAKRAKPTLVADATPKAESKAEAKAEPKPAPTTAATPPTTATPPPAATTTPKTPTKAPTKTAKKAEPKVRPAPRTVTVAANVKPALAAALTSALNDEALDNVDVGFIATDLKTGAVLAESGADSLINPASNAKMITSAAVLDALKPEYRFKTEYYVQGAVKDGTLFGNLIVKGYGDPTIVSERLSKVANELFLFGIEKITGNVVVDDSWFDANEEARGWELEDAPDRAYAAPVSALSVNYNAVAVYLRPASTLGAPALVSVDPPSERVTLSGEILTEQVGGGIHVVSQKDIDPEAAPGMPLKGTLLTIEGAMGIREPPARIYRRVYDPTRHFGSTLTWFMQQRGTKMRHSVVKGPVPTGARLILVDKSESLKNIVDTLNHYSNNIIAETLVKTMGAEVYGAPGTFENGLKVGRDFLEKRVGLAPGSYVYDNGSGLNDVNRFTARQLTSLVRTVGSDYEIATEWFNSLAVAGTQGTVGHRMKDTPALRRLRAKTGTLHGVSALSGTVVQPDGNVIAFSMLTQGYKSGASAIWKVQNLIGAAIASDGTWKGDDGEAGDEGDAVASVSKDDVVIELVGGG